MNELYHSKSSCSKWGGKEADYLPLHSFLDQTKNHFADLRHRSLLHSTFGIHLAEQCFGLHITNSDGKQIPVRDILERHIIEDMGRIPSVGDYLKMMALQPWLGGLRSYKRRKDKAATCIAPDTSSSPF